METFKKFDELIEPDERNLHFTVRDIKTGLSRRLSLKDVHRSITKIALLDSVPKDVISQFNVAKNLAVYSWFSYSFHQLFETE